MLSSLQKILNSPSFIQSPRICRFLRFIVETRLAGDLDQLKESVIGIAVFDRPAGYDPKLDAIVRVEARRLRGKLLEYYSARWRRRHPAHRLAEGLVCPGVRIPRTGISARDCSGRRAGASRAVHACPAASRASCLGDRRRHPSFRRLSGGKSVHPPGASPAPLLHDLSRLRDAGPRSHPTGNPSPTFGAAARVKVCMSRGWTPKLPPGSPTTPTTKPLPPGLPMGRASPSCGAPARVST